MGVIVWHGTTFPRGKYSDFSGHTGFISFAVDRDHARSYAVGIHREFWELNSRLFEVQLNITNPLDYRIASHANIVKEYLHKIEFKHFPKEDWDCCIRERGAYQCLEHCELLNNYGFDGVFTCESGWRNIHVLNHRLIKVLKIHESDPGSLGMSDEYGYRVVSDCCTKSIILK